MQQPTFVIGDVHGCFHTMMQLIAKIPSDARIIFTGDLCDRGNFSKEVIEFVSSNNYECILGNHDYHMAQHICNALEGIESSWISNPFAGGVKTLQSYQDDKPTIQRHKAWIKSLPQYIHIEHYFITHAFALPYYQRHRDEATFKALMYNRLSSGMKEDYEWEEGYEKYPIVNIFGHDNYDEVQIGKNYYAIDTGCVYGGKLTAIELGSMELIEQPLLKVDIS
ncbi:MAG: serine/threonine protein phosphatase [Campylobacterales bacterium]|nr:serine/threonine protein phosphatase [Campylobacterales bacterium]